MLLVTGDWHGEHRLNKRCLPNIDKLTKEDILFQLGDCGLIFHGNAVEEAYLDSIEKLYEFTLAFVDGNHENFDLLYRYPVEEWNGGLVHRIKNIVHLMRGQIYTINEKKIFTFGGGVSIDKARRKEGTDWWKEEMPSEEEYEIARQNLAKEGYKVDYILTHTAPIETVQFELMVTPHQKEKVLNNFLEWVREETTYQHWYFGHFHESRDLWRRQTVLLDDVRNMETNESVL